MGGGGQGDFPRTFGPRRLRGSSGPEVRGSLVGKMQSRLSGNVTHDVDVVHELAEVLDLDFEKGWSTLGVQLSANFD